MRANDPRIAMLKSLSIPFLVHGRSIGESRDYPFLDIDNTAAFYDAARLLIQLGHQRIALINGPEYLTFSIRRQKGMLRALSEHGLTLDEALVIIMPTSRAALAASQRSARGATSSTSSGCSGSPSTTAATLL